MQRFFSVVKLAFAFHTWWTLQTCVSTAKVCNVLSYGAIADKKTDVGPALTKAYADCVKASTGRPAETTVLVPEGDFAIASNVVIANARGITFTFNGQLHLVFDPKLVANMLQFNFGRNLIVNGKGKFNGYGDLYRPNRNLGLYPNRPRLIRFQDCINVDYSGFSLYDAPQFHLVVFRGRNFYLHDFQIICQTNIGTTDGIDISGYNK